jgi:hypothetical protein
MQLLIKKQDLSKTMKFPILKWYYEIDLLQAFGGKRYD